MNRRLLLTSLIAIVPLAACASSPSASDTQMMIGAWDISLFFDPAQPPSKTEMIITSVSGNNVKGSFYGAPFTSAMVIRDDSGVRYEAVTIDQSSDYFHRWRMLDDGTVKGETFSPQRGFRMDWSGQKK